MTKRTYILQPHNHFFSKIPKESRLEEQRLTGSDELLDRWLNPSLQFTRTATTIFGNNDDNNHHNNNNTNKNTTVSEFQTRPQAQSSEHPRSSFHSRHNLGGLIDVAS